MREPCQKAVRNTRQKRMMYEYLRRHAGEHTSAEELLEAMEQAGEPVAKSTVYRYLKQLEEEGRLRKYLTPERSGSCYQLAEDARCEEHIHLYCSSCGEVIHIDQSLMRSLSDDLFREAGFHVDDQKTILYGTCRCCAEKDKA